MASKKKSGESKGSKKTKVLDQRDVVKKLPVSISAEEQAAHIKRLGAVKDEIETLKEGRRKIGRTLKEKDGVINEIVEILRSGDEMQEVPCQEKWDYGKNAITITRKDNGALVDERPMTAQDRQMGMFGKDNGQVPEAPKDKPPAKPPIPEGEGKEQPPAAA